MSPSFPSPHPFSNGKSKESRTPAKKFRDRGEQGHKTVLRGIARRGDTETKAPTLGRVSSSYRKNAVKGRESSSLISASPLKRRVRWPKRSTGSKPIRESILPPNSLSTFIYFSPPFPISRETREFLPRKGEIRDAQVLLPRIIIVKVGN